jgi:predicted DCC family thiol-disulfide oxidoreductase YuxK
MPNPIVLYDGVCGLCNRLVRFIIRRDSNATFRFASLQGAFASRILARHHLNPGDLDTVYVVVAQNSEHPGELVLSRSDAALFVLKQFGGLYKPAAFLLQMLPRFFRDSAYNLVARSRYRIFGRFETCPLPGAQDRSRFLDL